MVYSETKRLQYSASALLLFSNTLGQSLLCFGGRSLTRHIAKKKTAVEKENARPSGRALVGSRIRSETLSYQFETGEEIRNLNRCGFRRIGTMDGVFANRFGEFGADGAWGRVSRVGCAHDFAVLGNRTFAF